MTATTAQIATVGGIGSPKVSLKGRASRPRVAGAAPVMLASVHPIVAPATTEPMPSVTISGWIENR